MKKTIIRSFSKAAPTYDAYAQVQEEVIHLLSMELERIDFQDGPQNILEIGCGTGNYTGVLIKRFKDARITAVDISEGMVAEARKKFFLHKSVEFFVVDAEFLTPSLRPSSGQATNHQSPITNHQKQYPFDLVTSNSAFHWFDDIEAGLKRIKNLMSEKGVILASVFGRETLRELQEGLKEVSDPETRISSSFFPDQDLLSSIFKDLFSGWEIKKHRIIHTYPDLITFLRTLKMTGTSAARGEKPIIRHPSVLRKMEKVFLGSYGKIQATYQVFICKGET